MNKPILKPLKIKLVFNDWRRMGKSVPPEEYNELSMREFHSGSTFPGEIHLESWNYDELKEAIESGLQPIFWIQLREAEGEPE